MIDYSEGYLQLDKKLHEVYKLMLSRNEIEAAKLLREIARISDSMANEIYLGTYQ